MPTRMQHGVSFKNLASGKYTLHVKAMSADGAVSRQERVLVIEISNPWWMQWWMILVYVIMIIAAVYIYRTVSKRINYIWTKKKEVINELARQLI